MEYKLESKTVKIINIIILYLNMFLVYVIKAIFGFSFGKKLYLDFIVAIS